MLAEIDSSNGALYHLTDALGSVRGLTDGTGALTGTSTYDAFGTVLTSTGTTSRLGYTGEQHDSETGYTFLRARYLNPAHGRFVSRDTVQPNAEGTQGYNRYGYVANNPTNWTDPSGNVTKKEICAFSFGYFWGSLFALAAGFLSGTHARGKFILIIQTGYGLGVFSTGVLASLNPENGASKSAEAFIGTHVIIGGLVSIRILAFGNINHQAMVAAFALLLAGVLILLAAISLDLLFRAFAFYMGINRAICGFLGASDAVVADGELPTSQNAAFASSSGPPSTDNLPSIPSVSSPTHGRK